MATSFLATGVTVTGVAKGTLDVASKVLDLVNAARDRKQQRARMSRALWLEARQNVDCLEAFWIADGLGSEPPEERRQARDGNPVADRRYLDIAPLLGTGAHLALLLAELDDPVSSSDDTAWWNFLYTPIKLRLEPTGDEDNAQTLAQAASFVVEKVGMLQRLAARSPDADALLRDMRPVLRLENILAHERALLDILGETEAVRPVKRSRGFG